MINQDKRVYIFGEVLFDSFADGNRVLGGAPFNVAWHLQAFGQSPLLISRIGRDLEGDQVRAAMSGWGLATNHLQVDPERPTGRVAVSITAGEPAYDIVADCAYDSIEPVSLPPASLLYHGSLAVRGSTSAESLRLLRASGPDTVFIDVNLRAPWWSPQVLHELLQGAQWVKLNGDELALLGGSDQQADAGRDFVERYQLKGLLLTHGARGAELLLAGGGRFQVAPALTDIDVVDTVGAGDAFASVMLLGLLNDWPMPVMLERAQQFAAAMVGQRGATVADLDFYRKFSQQWQLTD